MRPLKGGICREARLRYERGPLVRGMPKRRQVSNPGCPKASPLSERRPYRNSGGGGREGEHPPFPHPASHDTRGRSAKPMPTGSFEVQEGMAGQAVLGFAPTSLRGDIRKGAPDRHGHSRLARRILSNTGSHSLKQGLSHEWGGPTPPPIAPTTAIAIASKGGGPADDTAPCLHPRML